MSVWSTGFWLVTFGAVLATTLLLASVAVLVQAWRVRGRRDDAQGSRAEREPTEPPHPAVAEAQQEARRARQIAALATSLRLEEVLEQLLEVATATCHADAGGVALRQPGAAALVKTYMLSQNEVAPSLRERWDESQARAVTLHYRYPEGEEPRTDPIRSGLVVPLVGDDGVQLGALAVYWRSEREATEEELSGLEELAATSSRAIENAQQFEEASELAVLDGLTGLYNRRYFYDELGREVKRAHRYERNLALLVIDLDNFKAINDEIGHLGGDTILAEVAERLKSVVRGADIPCRVGGDEFAVILPEATLNDAEQLHRRLQIALEGRPIGRAERLGLSAGIAELQDDDESVSLFQRADQALFRSKREVKNQLLRREEPPLR